MFEFYKVTATFAIAGFVAASAVSTSAKAEWKPSGPLSLMIAFQAGGGGDTQSRLIARAIEQKRGWKIIPSNVTGKGGAVLATKLKRQPNDGLTIGMVVSGTVGYNMKAAKKPGYTEKDFTYITTTAGSQMGIYAKAGSGFKTWDDVAKVGKSGKAIKVGVMGQNLSDLAFLIAQKEGIKLNLVMTRGGRGVMNAVNAGDVDIGFGAGIQNKAIKSGALVHLLSATSKRLIVSPEVPNLKEKFGIPFSMNGAFLIIAPKGIPDEARASIASAIAEVLNDKSTKAAKFVGKAFGGPKLISGAELDKLIATNIDDAEGLLKAVTTN
ncbi:MAG: tripartite tricarboxylate transporter substrate-binding protein [Rhodospirillales bacterium]|nr:tripartite tricarboxylate transporter substrate-binding protein [Rhodospirillales bacterium]